MTDAALSKRPGPADIVNAYRLALGRDPETSSVIEEKVEHAGPDWLSGFFTSPEFHQNVRDSVLRGILPIGSGFRIPPEADLIGWAADQLPLREESRKKVRNANEWPELFLTIFADETFSSTVLRLKSDTRDTSFLSALERLAAISYVKGAIEFTSASEVRGWVVDTRDLDRRVAVELRFGDMFAGAAVPSIFRRDMQERFGGSGDYGFIIRFSAVSFHNCLMHGELREVASHVPLATVQLPPSPEASTELIMAVRRELDGLRSAIARIEARLPALSSAVSFSVENYDEYFEAFYAPQEAAVEITVCNIDLAVFIPVGLGEVGLLNRALSSVERQSLRPSEIIIGYDDLNTRLEVEYLLSLYQVRFGDDVALKATHVSKRWAGSIQDHMISCVSHRLCFLREPLVLAPDACAAITTGFDDGAVLLFADDDLLEIDNHTGRERHVMPRLRSCWDKNLFYQVDCLGPVVAIRRDRMDKAAQLTFQDGGSLYDLVFGIVEGGREAEIVHLPRVLAHRLSGSEDVSTREERKVSLENHLRRLRSEATVKLHLDSLGARCPGALRVCHPIGANTRATVIIPSRDRPDLLGPCLASLAASRAGSGVELDVIIVDNQSAIPPSRDFLDQFGNLAVCLMSHDGAFNWALINNRAAEQTSADVLIFLNDDTVMLSPESVDELCRQALRAEIGAVGARLLYEDNTIQHAGMVMDPWHSFATHEGIGATASDPGYLGRHTLVRQVATVTGACLATRSNLFKETGGFDAVSFPVEGNDTDYCLRLRALGYQIIYNPYASLYHFESKTRGFNVDERKRDRAFRATRALRERWGKRFENDPFYNPHFDRLSTPFSRLQPPPIQRKGS